MNKPYIVCHMMTSLDGRIDCKMTELLPGVQDYYSTLDSLDLPSTLSGRVTAELEMALPGEFIAKDPTPYGKDGFAKNRVAKGYEIVVDTKGKLLWPDASGMDKPYLIILSQQAKKEYLDYLNDRGISWIVCGEKRIDLAKACAILHDEFGVKRLGIVGGAAINSAFLDAGLLDEISILIGAGIDGRGEMASVFDGFGQNHPLVPLHLIDVKTFPSQAVWLRYKTK